MSLVSTIKQMPMTISITYNRGKLYYLNLFWQSVF